ncbi:hypothetical protein DHW03_13245 [Pedobacter yonginense]|uniref:Uncharacterized protein n=1 Tax=Pedobacter yonginense TaxID=651869 RepID=A0A317ELY2_9SPHI|nr:hypothetical protein DHW03_13245 [Pedobacter yonginense]
MPIFATLKGCGMLWGAFVGMNFSATRVGFLVPVIYERHCTQDLWVFTSKSSEANLRYFEWLWYGMGSTWLTILFAKREIFLS